MPGTTLSGGGTVTLNTGSTGGGGNAWLENTGSGTLTNVNNTIQGEGIIDNNGGILVNQANGTINANATASASVNTLALDNGTFNNQGGSLIASSYGLLQLNSTTVNNASTGSGTGSITASGPNASVQVYNSTIQGGTLNNSGGGSMFTTGASSLDGSTASGALTLSSGSTYTTSTNYSTSLLGSIINQGNFQVNGGNNTNSFLYVANGTTLTGGGTVTLNTGTTGGGGNAWFYDTGGTITNVNNTIQGEGILYNNGSIFVNGANGTINANSTGAPS